MAPRHRRRITPETLTSPGHFRYSHERCAVGGNQGSGRLRGLAFDEDLVAQAGDRILSDEEAQDIAELFKMLAHPTRVQILRSLADLELCVCDQAEVLGLSVSATSYQLQMMRRLKLVRYRRDGKFAYYRASGNFVLALLGDAQHHLGQRERSSR